MKHSPAYKISFCIVCMNRLPQLKKTLLKNLAYNATYGELEFILLDYNSKDGMYAWAKQYLQKDIDDGRLIYYKTNDPQEFNHSHAKNLAFKLASGDIICNINADHFTGESFAWYINEQFQKDDNIVLTPIPAYASEKAAAQKDVFGKVCMRKDHFMNIGGYDERMLTYGFEDFDIVNRLEMTGIKRCILSDPGFLKFIPHSDDRSTIGNNYEKPKRIFLRHINFYSSDILLLFTSGLVEVGKLIDESIRYADDIRSGIKPPLYRFEYALENSKWSTGQWKEDHLSNLTITTGSETKIIKLKKDEREGLAAECLNESSYFLLEDKQSIKDLMEFYYLFKNRSLLEINILTRNIRPNQSGFGKAAVFKNFDTRQAIMIP